MRQADGFHAEIVEVSCERSTGEKQSKYVSGFTATSKIPVLESESISVEGMR